MYGRLRRPHTRRPYLERSRTHTQNETIRTIQAPGIVRQCKGVRPLCQIDNLYSFLESSSLAAVPIEATALVGTGRIWVAAKAGRHGLERASRQVDPPAVNAFRFPPGQPPAKPCRPAERCPPDARYCAHRRGGRDGLFRRPFHLTKRPFVVLFRRSGGCSNTCVRKAPMPIRGAHARPPLNISSALALSRERQGHPR